MSKWFVCVTKLLQQWRKNREKFYFKKSLFFSPWHNSTAVLVNEDLYAGTVADFTGVDPIIFRKPLRTQQYDSTQLNSPDFVGSFSHKDFVYFFFREGIAPF